MSKKKLTLNTLSVTSFKTSLIATKGGNFTVGCGPVYTLAGCMPTVHFTDCRGKGICEFVDPNDP